ncbi:PstS family phosphate ABC transporter substrate-binding protein [Ralstonia holmesii]|uniref:PstS family phosphate ABC transporter substrate-binding protein n=2 Tax=Ralstonia holmesii TaxID=3058602 RepID=UPI003F13F72F
MTMQPVFAIRRTVHRARFAIALGAALIASVASAMAIEAQSAVDTPLPHFAPTPLQAPAGASYQNADGVIRIIGYNDMQGMLARINALFQSFHPEFKFELILKGTRTAPGALARGASLLAPMGAEFSDAELADYEKQTGTTPVMFKVAHDSLNPAALSAPLAIFVGAQNPLPRISMEQLPRVFAVSQHGVATWGQLGLSGEWASHPIHLCGLAPSTALGTLMLHRLGGGPFAGGFVAFPQSRDVVACVAADPLAIGFAAINRGVSGVRVVPLSEREGDAPSSGTREDVIANRYPLDRHLLIYLRTDAQQKVDPVAREYLRLMLSYEGQQEIANEGLGYLPLNARECAEELQRLSALE